LSEALRGPDWRRLLLSLEPTSHDVAQALTISKHTVLNNSTRMMDTAIANARRPYNAPRPLLSDPGDPFSAQFAPVMEDSRFLTARNESANLLLLGVLALRSFQLEHSTYPTNLSELVPAYLKQVPVDPFASGEPLRYRRTGSTYVLWSIGPDGVNNNGRAINDNSPVSSGEAGVELYRHRVLAQSKGDMVAGVNRGERDNPGSL